MIPYLLVSKYKAQSVVAKYSPSLPAEVQVAGDTRLLDYLIEASEAIDKMTGRRFDEYIATRTYTAYPTYQGGDLIDAYTLYLGADLKSLISVTNGDNADMLATVSLYPANARLPGMLRTIDSRYRWLPSSTTAYNCISLQGIWGYPSSWKSVSANLATDIEPEDEFILVDTLGRLEAGMQLKIGDEYLYVEDTLVTVGESEEDPTTYGITVERGFNGSQTVAHTMSESIKYLVPDKGIQGFVRRLVQWKIEQLKAPLMGQMAIGAVTLPINTSTMPSDVKDGLSEQGYMTGREPKPV